MIFKRGRFFCFISIMILMSLLFSSVTNAAIVGRTYTNSNYGLELGGIFCGYLYSAEGGNAVGVIVNEGYENGNNKKHIGGIKYNDLTITFGASMTKQLYLWIQSFMDGNNERKDGAIIYYDSNYRATAKLQFSHALINEVDFPAVDVTSKEPVKITLVITPETTRKVKSGLISTKAPLNEQKILLGRSFKFDIDGLSTACARVSKIGMISVKANAVQEDVGDARDSLTESSSLEFSDLEITISNIDRDAFENWLTSFIVDGNNDESMEKSGTLKFFNNTMDKVLFELAFHNLGIYEMDNGVVKIYCEKIDYDFPTGIIG